jgi:creatinine amidohydrolase
VLLVNGHGGNHDAVAQARERRPVSEMMDRLRREGVRSVSPNGILGDPRGATPAQGRRLLDELIAGCAQALDTLLDQDPAHA